MKNERGFEAADWRDGDVEDRPLERATMPASRPLLPRPCLNFFFEREKVAVIERGGDDVQIVLGQYRCWLESANCSLGSSLWAFRFLFHVSLDLLVLSIPTLALFPELSSFSIGLLSTIWLHIVLLVVWPEAWAVSAVIVAIVLAAVVVARLIVITIDVAILAIAVAIIIATLAIEVAITAIEIVVLGAEVVLAAGIVVLACKPFVLAIEVVVLAAEVVQAIVV